MHGIVTDEEAACQAWSAAHVSQAEYLHHFTIAIDKLHGSLVLRSMQVVFAGNNAFKHGMLM